MKGNPFVHRTCPISAKVTPAERLALERIAKIEQLNLSEAQRLCIREYAKRIGVWEEAVNSVYKEPQ
jgi:hypothetical protein